MKKSIYRKKLWGGRFKKPTDKLVEEFTESISFDYRLYRQDIRGSIAHVKMLGKCRHISKVESKKIIEALKKIEKELSLKMQKGQFKIDKSYEDIHTYIEKEVVKKVGEAVGSKLHTARSRNDQVALDMRLYIRDDIQSILGLLGKITEEIIKLAEKYPDCIMPGYTHMQLARPIYFRDYIRAYHEMFYRDIRRIIDCLKRMNYSPLGAGAVGGTHYGNINRRFVADELHFCGFISNTVDAVSDRDFVLEYMYDLAMVMVHLSRLSEDFVLWMTSQFNFIEIDDSFLTGSSILPQKKNPDVCELTRAKAGRVFGNLMAFLTVMKGLPMSYNRDMQEDKELLFNSSDTVKSSLKIYIKLLGSVKLKRENLLRALKDGYSTAPKMVDELARKGFSLRKSHEFVSKFIRYCEKNNVDFDNLDKEQFRAFLKTQRISGDFKKYLKKELKARN
jgi:argininosuccinate lyase